MSITRTTRSRRATTTGTIGTFAIDASGAWTFTANSAFDHLNVGDSVSETYDVTSVDGTPSTVQITINGTNDAPVLGRVGMLTLEYIENDPPTPLATFGKVAVKAGDEFLVNTTTTNGQAEPSVTGLAGGGFVVTWRDDSHTGGDTSGAAIRGQMFDASGTAVGSELPGQHDDYEWSSGTERDRACGRRVRGHLER